MSVASRFPGGRRSQGNALSVSVLPAAAFRRCIPRASWVCIYRLGDSVDIDSKEALLL